MSRWEVVPFDAAVEDVSAGNSKILQRDFLADGSYPIVDQGKDLIAGYSNEASLLCRAELPVIVFGDHTRTFKFVDFPFCIGADGVKVLRPKDGLDAKYLFHYLSQLRLPGDGYARHFKYLRRSRILRPPSADQRRIADVLDRVEEVRARRCESIALLDDLAQSIFFEIFGDPASNPKGWPQVPLRDVLAMPLRNGTSPSRRGSTRAGVLTLSAVTGGSFDAGAVKEGTFLSEPPENQTVNVNDFLICRGNGNRSLVGRGAFPTNSMPGVAFPDTIIAARVDPQLMERHFLQLVWHSSAVRRQVESKARTTNGTYKVNQTALASTEFMRPPLHLQQEFGRMMESLEALRTRFQDGLATIDELSASLQHAAFRGEL